MIAPQPPRRRHCVSTLPFVVLALLAVAACSQPPAPSPPPVRVQVVDLAPRTLPHTITAVGSFESPEMTTIASEVDGRITALDVPEGGRVEAGHVLARLESSEAQAALRIARARRTNARDRLTRLEKLRRSSVSSVQAYDDARSEFDAAAGAFREAQSRLEKTTLAAPFAGVVGLRQVNLGDVIDSGDAIVELTQVDPLELRFSVPQRHAGEVAVGQAVRGRVGTCGASFEGEVQAIDPRVDPATRSLQLQARVANPEGALYPGMAVSLRLRTGEITDALVVPQEAVVRLGTKHVVFVVDAEGVAEQRSVELGQFVSDGVHVVSGLEPGARVVATGQQKLRPGARTEAVPFEPVDNPNLLLGRFGPEGSCEPLT